MVYTIGEGTSVIIIYKDDMVTDPLVVAAQFKMGDLFIIMKTDKGLCWINTDTIATMTYTEGVI